jgi:hypothetical protein
VKLSGSQDQFLSLSSFGWHHQVGVSRQSQSGGGAGSKISNGLAQFGNEVLGISDGLLSLKVCVTLAKGLAWLLYLKVFHLLRHPNWGLTSLLCFKSQV